MPKQMRVMYDTEFHEDGRTIDLISIGMVREDGKEFYAVSNEFDLFAVSKNKWLMENVMSSIGYEFPIGDYFGTYSPIKLTDPAAMSRAEIRDGITEFLSDIWPELWAWYGAYDHVALCQLWGKMIDLPSRMPMFTCDIRQLFKAKGNPEMPPKPAGLHNALVDAHHNWTMYNFLKDL